MLAKVSDLQERQIINIVDGRCLGNVKDIELDLSGRIKAIILPGSGGVRSLLQKREEIAIPWEQVVRIGVDVVLVEVVQPEKNRGSRWLSRESSEKTKQERWQEELAAYRLEQSR